MDNQNKEVLLKAYEYRIQELSQICAEAYQVVGVMASDCGRFGDEAVIKAMDNLSAQELIHEDVLPFPSQLPVAQMSGNDACHDEHCNQGEYEGSCKYGEADTCPTLRLAPIKALTTIRG